MKNLITLLLLLASTTSMAATGADMESVIVECDSVSAGPDHGMSLQVITGGIAGLTRIETAESWIGGVRQNSYIVSERQLPPSQKNNFIIFSSRQVALQIDITKKDSQGRYAATFIRDGKVRKSATSMFCKLN